MVTKLKKNKTSKKADVPLTGSVKDSAQQIWQAGLGAFNKAQAEGSKAFEALVKEGVSLQRKTQAAAEEKISEATNKMSSMATDISSKASGQWDKLENIFEDRVAKVLNKLGVPSAKDVNALIARIDELNKSVQRLSTKDAAPKTASKVASRAAPRAASRAAPKQTTRVTAKTVIKADPATTPDSAAKAATKRAAARKTATAPTPV
ncbi:phasin family protein [Rhodoferax ferrireducens]|uniref:phasin family protein n=1 Tax=Rhodoferax ferrireducens TaxID=192843 RepID=UPI000E0CF863|nr:phasin family protein [Rhodoferax ferrireducens]